MNIMFVSAMKENETLARTGDASDEAVGIRIQSVRFVAGQTQSVFASTIGTTGNVVGNWERGAASPRHHALARICEEYSVSADYVLLGRIGQFTMDEREEYLPALLRATLDQKAKNAAKDLRAQIGQLSADELLSRPETQ